MKLTISGRPVGAGVNQLTLRSACNFMGCLLMANDMPRLMSIEVAINLIPNLKKDYGLVGECNWTDDRFRPNKFYIDVDAGLDYKAMLITCGHELTHIKQMATLQRTETQDGTGIYWLGMLHRPDDMDYYDLPWEIDAHGREFGLYDRFRQREQGIKMSPASIVNEATRLVAV